MAPASSDGARQRRGAIQRLLVMASLILSGEAIFSLPFHVARFFRPTMLEVFRLTNTQLGGAQAVYGVLAMIAYLPGGPLADRFPARKLITASLISTAAGGLYLATLPGLGSLWFLFGFWGVTTIVLFWAAMIRATREWGEDDEQGKAFGLLDGGRGLVAASLASIAVLLFGLFFPDDPAAVTDEARASALRNVILAYTGVTGLTGVLVWFTIPDPPEGSLVSGQSMPWSDLLTVARRPSLWFHALVIICAYVGYKGMDNYSLYAVQVYGMNEVDGAGISALGAWVRPFAAVGAGLVADRLGASRTSIGCFLLMLVCYAATALYTPTVGQSAPLYATVLFSCVGVFGMRGVYFALLEEGKVPAALTGATTGLVSQVGYTPDIFVSPLVGILLDRSPGLAGHQHFFIFMGIFAALGLLASYMFGRVTAGSSTAG